jgi:hypothetical protein
MFEFKPYDIVVVDGLWYMPHHWLIRWRGLDKGVHCVTLINDKGSIWNPVFAGIKVDHVDSYKGRHITVHRYKKPFELGDWGATTVKNSSGYDFFRQWLLGFVLGMATKALSNDETKWTCAEFPYWAFQDNGYKITEKDETLPMPRLFRYNKEFECVYEGTL